MVTPSAALGRRSWVPSQSEALVQSIASASRAATPGELTARVGELIAWNDRIHLTECVNLNPATNSMNPAAAAALGSGLGTRTSLGYPGAKYEMGLEAIEQIEVIAAELAAEVFGARFAEVRVPSGALANLYAFMACARPGDSIIVPPATIAGHATHHRAGAAGLYGLEIHEAPIDADNYTIDVAALAALAEQVRPRMISVGASLNLAHHDVAGIREVADSVDAVVLFDAAHLSGPIAGKAWPNPLEEGAHIMTMSTYKSLGGPTAGLLVTNEASLAERVDAIAFPGLTANFDAGKTAALAITLVDWLACGEAYAAAMTTCARRLADALSGLDVPIFQVTDGPTRSHAFAVDCGGMGGGHDRAVHLRKANLLTSAIGLPTGLDDGLRVGTNELVRWGATSGDMPELAELISRALTSDDPSRVAPAVTAYRSRFDTLHYLADGAGR
jgi:glycine hydroxymethyltransferase